MTQEHLQSFRMNSWKSNFSGYRIQQALTKINHTEKRISKLCKTTISPISARLYETTFWDDLIHSGNNKAEVEACLVLWKKIKPFAHLNAKDLLILLSEEITPLERQYQQTLVSLQNEKLHVESNHFWPTHWFQFNYDDAVTKLQENAKRIIKIKSAVHQALLLRCEAHQFLKAPRNVDDIMRVLFIKLNNLKLLKEPFPTEEPLCATLDDDRRLAIYDLLEHYVADKDKLNSVVVSVVPKRKHTIINSDKEINNELKILRKFQTDVLHDLDSSSNEEDSFSRALKKFTPRIIKKTWSNTVQVVKDTITDIGIFSVLLKLWALRYILYLTLSFVAYHFLVQTFMPIVSVLLGVATTNLLSNVMFYTLALGPAWYLGYICTLYAGKSLHDYFTHWKRNDIESSLSTLVNAQECIANHLSQTIIDIPHFDIQHLENRLHSQLENLRKAKIALSRYSWWERLLCRGYIDKAREAALAKVEAQQKQFKAHLNMLASHIAMRVGQDIQLLEKAIAKQELVPILPKKQLDNLKKFVMAYGTANALNTFIKNTNIIDRWINKLERCSMPQVSEHLTLLQPWGGHEVREDYIKGWDILLQAFSGNPQQSEAARQLNNLLRGQECLSPEALVKLVTFLDAGKKVQQFHQKLQAHLFNTLSSVNPQMASMLSENQKALIANWYKLRHQDIKNAKRELNKLFSIKNDATLSARMNEYDDEALSRMYELLDGADIYAYSSNQKRDVLERKNLARKYFEEYQGESSLAIRFLRFLQVPEQQSMIIHIAKKRLTWLLANLHAIENAAKPFNQLDTELFQDHMLNEQHEKFNITEFLMQSKEFNQPWDQKIELFFEACRKNGFESGKIVKQYRENNKRIKPFMLHQHDNARKLISCKKAESNLPSTVKTRKKISDCH